MPTLPWTHGPADANDVATHSTALGSRLVLRRYRDVPAFLRLSMRLHREAARAPGCVGVGLRAEVRRRTFWTASLWTDPQAIRSFVASPTHRRAMTTFADRMHSSAFETWSSSRPPTWSEVGSRLAGEHQGATAH